MNIYLVRKVFSRNKYCRTLKKNLCPWKLETGLKIRKKCMKCYKERLKKRMMIKMKIHFLTKISEISVGFHWKILGKYCILNIVFFGIDKTLDGLSVEQLMALLTLEQRMDFERKFKEEKLTFNKVWTPWWLPPTETGLNRKKVLEMSEMTWIESVMRETLLMPYPYIIENPDINGEIVQNQAIREAIMANISEVLLCYICACVYFNGDMMEREGICLLILESSAILTQKVKSFPSFSAVRSYIQQNGLRNGRTGEQLMTLTPDTVLKYFDNDCKSIMMEESKDLISLSLNHIHFLLKSCCCGKDKRNCFRSMKTIEYYIKFVKK